MISGGPIRPATATAAPGAPAKREPNTTEELNALGPGRKCDSANASLNSSAVIQCFCSTIIRRAHGNAPPKPETDTMTKARNSSESAGRLVEGVADMTKTTTARRRAGPVDCQLLRPRCAK